jgi:hypothetical protein
MLTPAHRGRGSFSRGHGASAGHASGRSAPDPYSLIMEGERQRPSLLALGGSVAAALAVSVLGWLALVLSAGLAMGSASDADIATALAVAGAAALSGIALAGLALLKGRRAAVQVPALLGVAANGVLGVVALVFAFSFHW